MNIFTKEEIAKFEHIWIQQNVHNKYGEEKKLPDVEYINYHIWEDINWAEMYYKNLPDTKVVRGKNNILVFHGGCLGCNSQPIHGVNRCKGCKYFKFDHDKPNLFIEGGISAKFP